MIEINYQQTPEARAQRKLEKFWTAADEWPVVVGYVFLANAFYHIGKAMFGNEWTGRECVTKKPPAIDFAAAIAHYKSNPQSAAILERAQKQSAINALAYRRRAKVQQTIAIQAQAGLLPTAWREVAGGEMVPLPASYWNTEALDHRFRFCQMSLSQPFTDTLQGLGYIFVEAAALQRLLQPASGAPAALEAPGAADAEVAEIEAEIASMPGKEPVERVQLGERPSQPRQAAA